MAHTPIIAPGSPPPMAPYSPAVRAGNVLYVSGAIAMDKVYREYFPADPPARYCIRADLVKPEFLVEIASIAHLKA